MCRLIPGGTLLTIWILPTMRNMCRTDSNQRHSKDCKTKSAWAMHETAHSALTPPQVALNAILTHTLISFMLMHGTIEMVSWRTCPLGGQSYDKEVSWRAMIILPRRNQSQRLGLHLSTRDGLGLILLDQVKTGH